MADALSQGIGSIFSVLPEPQAAEGRREVLERYATRRDADAIEVAWVGLDQSGDFVRGGVTYVDDASTLFIHDPASHSGLTALVRGLPGAPPRPGRINYDPVTNCLYWYAPQAVRASDRARQVPIKGLKISLPLFVHVIGLFDANRGVTPAEKRMLFQLVAGLGPREAAAADGVSFETKRAQVKSLCAKIGCRGQTELVQYAMGQLIHLLNVTDEEDAHSRIAEQFVSRFLPSNVRLSIHGTGQGGSLRTVECGPPNGRPVLLVHGMLYPLLLISGAGECERLGIRLIMPLRTGYLDDQSAAALYARDDAGIDMENIARLVAMEAGGAIPVIGHSMGASWAIRFARLHPERVTNLVLLSPHFAGDRHAESRFAPFLDGLRSLADRPGMFRFIAWQFRKYYVDTKLVRRVLRKLFGGSLDDLAVLEGQRGAEPVYDWFAASYRTSVVGIARDMAAGMSGWQTELNSLPCSTDIIYGVNDPVALFSQFDLPDLALARALPAGGHLVAASHPTEVWNALERSICDYRMAGGHSLIA